MGFKEKVKAAIAQYDSGRINLPQLLEKIEELAIELTKKDNT